MSATRLGDQVSESRRTSSRTLWANLPSWRLPTAETRTLSPTAFLMASESGTWYPGPLLKNCAAGWLPPAETSMRSTPCSARIPASLQESSRRQEGSSGSSCSTPSVAEMLQCRCRSCQRLQLVESQEHSTYRTRRGIVGGITARTPSTTSMRSLIRFSNDPPYSSVRLFAMGLMKELIKNPCAP